MVGHLARGSPVWLGPEMGPDHIERMLEFFRVFVDRCHQEGGGPPVSGTRKTWHPEEMEARSE